MRTEQAHFRIGYDARLALGNYRGMGRFLRFLIAGREQMLTGFCAARESDDSLATVAGGTHFYPLWEQCWLPRAIVKHRMDAFLAPFNTAPLALPSRVMLILVVHDLIFMEDLPQSPSRYQNLGRMYRRAVVPRAIERADRLITVSNYTRDALARRFPSVTARIEVIPNTIPEWWLQEESFPKNPERYILAVAGEAPSKNLGKAIESFARVRELTRDPGLRMKVAGVKPEFHAGFLDQGNHLGLSGSIELLSYVPDAVMRDLFRNAQLFLMPSLLEGFGIPVLEAMACGAPVVCSSASCLPEIAEDAAMYFDPRSAEEMAAAMLTVLSDNARQEEMSRKGRNRVRQFHSSVVRERAERFWASLTESLAARV